MPNSLNVVISFDHFAEIAEQWSDAAGAVVSKTVHDIEAGAKNEAPVATGFLKNSIQSNMTGPLSGEVNVGAVYGPYVNYGTVHMPARPFFDHAVERGKESFTAACNELLQRGGGGALSSAADD